MVRIIRDWKSSVIIGENKIPLLDSQYTDMVTLQVLLPMGEKEKFVAELIEGTNGRVQIEEKEELYYGVLDGNVLMGEALRGE